MLKSKKRNIMLYVFPAIAVMAISVFFRLYPLIIQGKQDAQKLATAIVLSDFRQKVQKYVELNSPGLGYAQKLKLVENEFQVLIRSNRKQISESINEGMKKIIEYRPKDTPQYLLEADSYYFYGLTENIRDFGTISKNIKNGKFFNPLMLAPNGNWQPFCLHPYVGFYLYKLVSLFNPQIEMISAIHYTVIIAATICVIPFVLICYTLGLSALPTFAGSMFFMLSPFFAQRTAYGWYDTDVYNILFPLAVFFFLILAFDSSRKLRTQILYFICAAFLTALYELFWEGWGFICVVMLLTLPFVLVVNKKLFQSYRLKSAVAGFGAYLLASLLWISLFNSPFAIIDTFRESWKMLNSFLISKFDLWPNIFLTVGETQPMSIPKISFLIFGNVHLLYLAALGPIIFLIKSIAQKHAQRIYSGILLSVFTFSFIYLSAKAARNAVLLTVPLTIAFTLSIDSIYGYLKKLIANRRKVKILKAGKILRLGLSIILLCISAIPIYGAYQICSRIYPIYNQTWDKVLTQLRKDTPEDSIINTWWCPGHFVTSVAKRATTVDGATQHLPQTYWMATILMSADEKCALGLLRMLNLSGNNALDYLENTCHMTTSDSIDLLKEIAPLGKDESRAALLKKIKSEDAENILTMTQSTPRPSYFLIYNDLVDTYMALPFFGNWDFKKAELLVSLSKNNKQKVKIPTRSSKGYIDFLWSLTGGVPPVSPQYPQIYKSNSTIMFENNFVVELTEMDCFLLSPDATKFVNPKSVIYVKNNELKEKFYQGNTLPFSVLLLEKDDVYKCIILDSAMAKSLLFRLYYLNGKGLSAFKPFINEEDPLTNTNISVYKIDWSKS